MISESSECDVAPAMSPQERMRAADPLGDRVHLLLACLAGLSAALDTGPSEGAFIALSICFLTRLPRIAAFLGPFFRRTLVWLLIVWAVYAALSLLWSPDPAQGGQELLRIRFFLLPILLYPVVDRARLVLGSFLVGVALLHGFQALQVLDLMPESIDRDRYIETRYSGVMHPVVSANIITCAAALHLGALLWALSRSGGKAHRESPERLRGLMLNRVLLISALGFAAAIAGLILTGSRGPWLAALALLPLQLLTTLIRRRDACKFILIVLSILLLIGSIGSIWLYPLAADRYKQARDDISAVFEEGDYRSHTGARIFMGKVAWQMFLDRPVFGFGGGSYRSVGGDRAEAMLTPELHPRPRSLIHGHAHNMYLHEAATRGVIGLGLVIAVLISAIMTAARSSGAQANQWQAGLPWAIAAMALCALFDHPLITHNNAFTTMLLFALALQPTGRCAASHTGRNSIAAV